MGRLEVDGRVSAIVPVYNGENYLEYCLYSLIAQTYDNLEIVVVNDGSTDRSEEIAQDILGRSGRLFNIYKTNGPSAFTSISIKWPWLVGVGNSTGEYISYHCHDNLSDSRRFEILMDFRIRNKEFGRLFFNKPFAEAKAFSELIYS